MKFKISKTWIVIIIIILIIIGYYSIKSALKDPSDDFITEEVSIGDVVQEVSETGNLKATEDISLAFKIIGRISKVNVRVGDTVKKGQILAEINASQTLSQLQSSRAALNSANKEYDKLIKGLTPEQIKTYEDAVTLAENNLQGSYGSALNILYDAYNKIYNSYNTIVSIERDNFGALDQQGIKVSDSKGIINIGMQGVKDRLDVVNGSRSDYEINSVISQMASVLKDTSVNLKIIRNQFDLGIYYAIVSSADKTSLDTHITNINTASTSITTLQNTITGYKTALQTARNSLTSATASARDEDVDIYQASISQARSNLSALQSQLNDNYLVSPIDGKITVVDIKIGQVVSSSVVVINLLSTEPFQIKSNIYERDIVNVNPGDIVEVDLVAFPRQMFEGRVVSIEPAETIINGVVYYQVTIEFPNQPEGIRSGMTADIVIQTNKKENVLRVPKNTVVRMNGTTIVQIVNGNGSEDKDVTVGLEGNDYIEILSGLSEGEKIVLSKKQ